MRRSGVRLPSAPPFSATTANGIPFSPNLAKTLAFSFIFPVGLSEVLNQQQADYTRAPFSATMPSMKVLILSGDTQQYLASDGSWNSAISEAHDFRFSPYAFEVIRKEKFSNTTVVF